MDRINITRAEFRGEGEWNYTIRPIDRSDRAVVPRGSIRHVTTNRWTPRRTMGASTVNRSAQNLRAPGSFNARTGHEKTVGWLGDLDSNQGCPGQSREFYR